MISSIVRDGDGDGGGSGGEEGDGRQEEMDRRKEKQRDQQGLKDDEGRSGQPLCDNWRMDLTRPPSASDRADPLSQRPPTRWGDPRGA